MEFTEALLTLGVCSAAEWETLSPEALKRVYLKQVRAHPPEQDPQGFQRVREAYELLQALQATRAAFRDSVRSAAGAVTSDESVTLNVERQADETDRVVSAQKPTPVRSAFDRLQRPSTEQQYDTGADAMLELYSSATLASPPPPPPVVFAMISKQFISGAQDRGRRLFLAFEADMTRMNRPLSARLAANWKLLAELVALSDQVPPTVLRALASAIESGNFEEATESLRFQLDERGLESRIDLESSLQRDAPTLYQAAWPKTPGVSRKQRRTEETWALRMLLLMLVLVSSFSLHILETSSSRRTNQTHYTQAHESVANLGALSAEQARALELVTTRVEKVVRFSRCHQLRAVWGEYTSVVRPLKGYESVMRGYEEHRANAGTTCPELSRELPESP